MNRGLLSIDVEDWYNILALEAAPHFDSWDSVPARVEKNFHVLLDILEEQQVTATCFFLGYVAKRFPSLVRRAAESGHEIASHGFRHELVYTISQSRFLNDAVSTRALLEDQCGKQVRGYRAAGFSVTRRTPWFFSSVLEAGYLYDSSVFPGRRTHGGLQHRHSTPHWIRTQTGHLFEIPISLAPILGYPICFSGGGYLRLFPYRFIRHISRRLLQQGNPVTFYVHPRDIDVSQPRMNMSWSRRFRSYVGLATMERKLKALSVDFKFATYEECFHYYTYNANSPSICASEIFPGSRLQFVPVVAGPWR